MPGLFNETVFALSSGRLPSGVAIVRVSGSKVALALQQLTGILPSPRQATLVGVHAASGAILDSALALFFPGPRSFTGEDCAELHLHGGAAVVSAVLEELASIPDVRQAEPGEFTKRAFLNGKLDLTAAEALADLIGAETESQRRLALSNMRGAQHELYGNWHKRLLHARAMIEAELDFADEGDVPGSVADRVWADMRQLRCEIVTHIGRFSRAEMIRDGVRVVILGAPNAGKSSLLNALARRDVAIVSDEPGTTRDLLEVALDLGGVKVVVTDTAGIRPQAGKVEAMGIARARSSADQAHLVVMVTDVSHPVDVDFNAEARPVLSVGAKADLPAAAPPRSYDLVVSVVDGSGVDALLERLAEFARNASASEGETLPSRNRHIQHLTDCGAEIDISLAQSNLPMELRAEHLRNAANALGRITGRVDVEDLLGVIFSEFCIGK